MLAERARIVLACAEPGSGVARVAAELGSTRRRCASGGGGSPRMAWRGWLIMTGRAGRWLSWC